MSDEFNNSFQLVKSTFMGELDKSLWWIAGMCKYNLSKVYAHPAASTTRHT